MNPSTFHGASFPVENEGAPAETGSPEEALRRGSAIPASRDGNGLPTWAPRRLATFLPGGALVCAVEGPRELEPTSQIAQERAEPGHPSRTFLLAVGAMALVAFGLAAELALYPQPIQVTPAEEAAQRAPGGLLDTFGLSWARLVSAASFAVTVSAVAVVGRRLFHSDGVALLAAALVLLDPGFLTLGRLALPDAIAVAGLLGALAFFLSTPPWAHWAGSLMLGLAAAADPTSLVWGVPMVVLLLIRGHIYAAPRHLGLAALQTLALPTLAAGLHLLATDGAIRGVVCQLDRGAAFTLAATTHYGLGIHGLHNPVTWFGGLGATLLLAAASLSTVARQFRLARLPGRVQMRLAFPLQPIQARILWILAFAVLIPFPNALMPILALALAAGIGHLAEDAPGFGLAVALVVLLFAGLVLWRAWGLVAGTASPAEAQDILATLVPWTRVEDCVALPG